MVDGLTWYAGAWKDVMRDEGRNDGSWYMGHGNVLVHLNDER
jgi:hypothetical protein